MIYGHGDDTYSYSGIRMNFSTCINSYADLTPLVRHLSERLEQAIRTYPEPQPFTLERTLATHLGVLPEEVCVTAGATDAIYLIAQRLRGSRSAIAQPTFSEYADACRLHGHHLVDMGDPSAEVIWLCNPNNPTGKVLDKATLSAMITTHPGTTFVIDQSYEDFTIRPLLTAAEAVRMPNVLLLHSMTKRYALPGLRLGYVTASSEHISRLRAQRMPWSVSTLAIEAGLYVLKHPDEMPLQAILSEAHRLRDNLRSIPGIEVEDSDTHFMLCRIVGSQAAALKEHLASEHGILIRDASNFYGLDESCFRIAARTAEENDALVRAIRGVREVEAVS